MSIANLNGSETYLLKIKIKVELRFLGFHFKYFGSKRKGLKANNHLLCVLFLFYERTSVYPCTKHTSTFGGSEKLFTKSIQDHFRIAMVMVLAI